MGSLVGRFVNEQSDPRLSQTVQTPPGDSQTLLGQFVGETGVVRQNAETGIVGNSDRDTTVVLPSLPRDTVLRGHFIQENFPSEKGLGIEYDLSQQEAQLLNQDYQEPTEENLYENQRFEYPLYEQTEFQSLEESHIAPPENLAPVSGNLAPVPFSFTGESHEDASTARGFIDDILGRVHLKKTPRPKPRNLPHTNYQPPPPS